MKGTLTRTACSLAILMNFGPVKQTVWVQPFFETNNNKSSAFGHRVRVPTGRYLQRKTSVRIPLTCNAAVPIGAANGTSLGGRYVAKILKEDSILCHLVYSQSFRDIYCRRVAISVKPHLDFLDHQHLGSAVLSTWPILDGFLIGNHSNMLEPILLCKILWENVSSIYYPKYFFKLIIDR